jgi:ABC-type branched-subunit amino acid transport system substrate-binding protein
MTFLTLSNRRTWLQIALGITAQGISPAWAQLQNLATSNRQHTVAQIVDMSASQVDVSKDFVVGSRAAWQDINSKGGLRGGSVRHLVLEVDGSDASLRTAVDALKNQPQCIALFGTAGGRVASQVANLLRKEAPDLAHIAPWLQNPETDATDTTFPIFASRAEQISYAVKTLSIMGIPSLGVVYGSPSEYSAYRESMVKTASKLNMQLVSYAPTTDLKLLGSSLTSDSPRILIFLGGTPELIRFSQGIDQQSAQRYIIAMSDVNVQTMAQMGGSKHASIVATQVVPLVNSSLPIVKSYRETLGRLYDEPPSPQSLAGYIAANYTHAMLQEVDGVLTRANLMQTMQKRRSADIGGFRITLDTKLRTGNFVTQSMLASDGRLIG